MNVTEGGTVLEGETFGRGWVAVVGKRRDGKAVDRVQEVSKEGIRL